MAPMHGCKALALITAPGLYACGLALTECAAAATLLLCRSFQTLGLAGLGFSQGFERLHYLLDTAFDGDQLSHRFKKASIVWARAGEQWEGSGWHSIVTVRLLSYSLGFSSLDYSAHLALLSVLRRAGL